MKVILRIKIKCTDDFIDDPNELIALPIFEAEDFFDFVIIDTDDTS